MSIATQTIRLGHSPDSDDAFMFWGLAQGMVQSELQFEHILRDIQTLNEWAKEGKLESSAVSVHAFASIADKYALLRHGGSFGDDYGPMIVAKRELTKEKLKDVVIAIPGKLTSAFLALNLYFDELFPGDRNALKYEVMAFDEILEAVRDERVEAGLLIHEGQLTYKDAGLVLVQDMGRWWKFKTGLPLPLGVNVVRKDLGEAVVREVSRCMKESIQAGLQNRNQALEYALQFARGLDMATSDEFVGMYVNDRTADMGEEGIQSIKLFLREGARIGLVPQVDIAVVD